MENKEKQLFIKDLKRELKFKISESKQQQKAFNTLGGLKILMENDAPKDEVMVILDKLQAFAEKQLAEEIEFYEGVLLELQQIKPKTEGMVA